MSALGDPPLLAAIALAGLVVVVLAGLRAWHDWLDFRRQALARGPVRAEPATASGARIELADLRERIRKLEAIAAGVEL